MEKGLRLCSDYDRSVVERARVLRAYQLERFQDKRKCIFTTPCCDRCETIGEHMSLNCTLPSRKDGAREVCSMPDCGEECPDNRMSNQAQNDEANTFG
jgi:hypothetical protein